MWFFYVYEGLILIQKACKGLLYIECPLVPGGFTLLICLTVEVCIYINDEQIYKLIYCINKNIYLQTNKNLGINWPLLQVACNN